MQITHHQARTLLLFLLAAALAGLGSLGGPPFQPGGGLLLLTVMALVLEARAVELPQLGFFSSATSVYLAASLIPEAGGLMASLLAVSCVALRTVARGRSAARESLRDAAGDLACVLAANAAAQLLVRPGGPVAAGLCAALTYLGMAHWVGPWLAAELPGSTRTLWLRWHDALSSLRLAVATGGPGLALLMAQSPWNALWLLPLLLGTHRAAENVLFRLQARRAREALEELEVSRQALQRAERAARVTERELRASLEQRNLLEGFSRHLAADPGLDETLQAIVSTVSALVPARSVAVFLSDPEEHASLRPACFQTPDRVRLENARLLGVTEPLVEEVWRENKPRLGEGRHAAPARLFPGELSSVAFPLESQGVLYVGRERQAFAPQELDLLAWTAGKAALAVESSRRRRARDQALAAHSRAHYVLKGRLDLLSRLMEGSRAIASTLEPRRLLEELRSFLLSAVPHDFGAVLLSGSEPRPVHWCVRGMPGLDPQAVQALAAAVDQSQRPLLWPDLDQSPFPRPAPDVRSLMAAPMRTEQERVGMICVGAVSTDIYTREHLDILAMIAYQTAVALKNAQHHEEVVEARRLLEASQLQLIQSSKMTAVGQLAAGIAHELNSPLGAVLLALDAAAPQVESESLLRKLNSARKAAERARQIIKKLLFYSRKSPLGREKVDIPVLVRDTLEFIGGQIENEGFEVKQALEPVPAVLGKANELQQVLINLLLNAVAAAGELPPGEASRTILITARQDADAVVMAVRDWGPGIPEEHLSRVFDPFFTTREVGEGTGLGLSVSRQIVARHGGTMAVESLPGQGATFSLRLPVGGEPRDEAPVQDA